LTVALPTLARDLHASTSQLQWFSSAYTLVLAAVLLPAGAFGDRLGRKRMLLAGLAVFAGASVWCAYSGSAGVLIAARGALGLGAAVMMPLSLAVLPSIFPDSGERARAFTIWVTSTAVGLPLGPILGGWLLEHFWWGSVFLINVPLVLAGGIAVAVLVPESPPPTRKTPGWKAPRPPRREPDRCHSRPAGQKGSLRHPDGELCRDLSTTRHPGARCVTPCHRHGVAHLSGADTVAGPSRPRCRGRDGPEQLRSAGTRC
jgi:MFS family permease